MDHRRATLPALSHAGGSLIETAAALFIAVVVVVALYAGADLLVPLALAVLISFALAPLTIRLRRMGLPHIPSVLAAVLVAVLIVGGGVAMISRQLVDFAGNLQRYEETVRAKIRAAKAALPAGGAIDSLKRLEAEMRGDDATAIGRQVGGQVEVSRPVPVEVQDAGSSALAQMGNILTPILGPIGTAGLVVVFTLFILVQREELRDRAIRLIGGADLARTTLAIDDGASRIARYLVAQLIVNVTYGIPFGLGLWVIGIPHPVLWATLAVVLRFVPYVGPVVAATGPLLLAIAVDPGWEMLVVLGAFILALELVSNNVVEPWIYGSSTGLSAVAVVVSAVFWTSLWGPVGLLLATPLTVCLVVLGRHVPSLGFLEIMLGDAPALTIEARIYQRLLADDVPQAELLAEEAMQETDPVGSLVGVLVRVLQLAEHDRQRGVLEPGARRAVAAQIREIAAELVPDPPDRSGASPTRILCVGGPNELEAAAATLLAGLLESSGQSANAAEYRSIASGDAPEVLVLVTFEDAGNEYRQRLHRRLSGRYPRARLVEWRIPPNGPSPPPDSSSSGTGMLDVISSLGLSSLPGARPEASSARSA